MKLFSVLGVLCIGMSAATNPQLVKVQSVYILPMSNGMDQYLANSLTTLGVFQVVADPQKADSILTDHLGESFEQKLKELYPPPPAPKPAGQAATAKKADDADKNPVPPDPSSEAADKDKDKDSKADAKTESTPGKSSTQFQTLPMQSTFGRGRGNFFLVDRGSRSVLWSIYELPKNSTPGELTKIATRVVQRLKKDLEPPKPQQ